MNVCVLVSFGRPKLAFFWMTTSAARRAWLCSVALSVLVSREVLLQIVGPLTLTFLSLHFVQDSNCRAFTRFDLLSGAGGGADWGTGGP